MEEGAWLAVRVRKEDVVVYRESPGDVRYSSPRPPFLHNITFCSPALHHGVLAQP